MVWHIFSINSVVHHLLIAHIFHCHLPSSLTHFAFMRGCFSQGSGLGSVLFHPSILSPARLPSRTYFKSGQLHESPIGYQIIQLHATTISSELVNSEADGLAQSYYTARNANPLINFRYKKYILDSTIFPRVNQYLNWNLIFFTFYLRDFTFRNQFYINACLTSFVAASKFRSVSIAYVIYRDFVRHDNTFNYDTLIDENITWVFYIWWEPGYSKISWRGQYYITTWSSFHVTCYQWIWTESKCICLRIGHISF